MNPFRKSKRNPYVVPGSVHVEDTTVVTTKEVSTKGCPEPTTYVETKVVHVSDYSDSLGLPTDDDYQLRDMIKSGHIPEEVPVRGMLDSQDPLDLSNSGVGDAIFDELQNQVNSNKPAPAVEPASTVEPSNEE